MSWKKSNSENKTKFKICFSLLGLAVLLLLWETIPFIYGNFNVFPPFHVALIELFNILGKQRTYLAVLTSVCIAMISILISFLFAFVLGIISGFNQKVKYFFSSFISIFKIIPTACLIILLIIFISNYISYFIIVLLIVFPIIYEGVVKGVESIDQSIIDSLKIEGIFTPNSIFKVIIPMISPFVRASLASAIGIGFKVEIMSEIIIGSNSIFGLGYLIYEVRNITFDYVEIYSYIILIVIIYEIFKILGYFLKKLFKVENFYSY